MLEIHSITTGPFQENCHILQNPATMEIVVVDPGDDAPELTDFLQRLGGRVVAIWNTHGHIDHIGANAAVQRETSAPISIHEMEQEWLGSAMLCGAAIFGIPFEPSKAETLWKGGETISALGCEWKVRHAPGHSPGMCTISCDAENLIIVGDLIMMNSIGRTDLPGGDERAMAKSLSEFFKYAKPDWRMLCGHGDRSTVQKEIRLNENARYMISEFGF
ncbi:MAG: MBL fold metallo-hydrolase [Candidatus Sumerlaeota bacterium]